MYKGKNRKASVDLIQGIMFCDVWSKGRIKSAFKAEKWVASSDAVWFRLKNLYWQGIFSLKLLHALILISSIKKLDHLISKKVNYFSDYYLFLLKVYL